MRHVTRAPIGVQGFRPRRFRRAAINREAGPSSRPAKSSSKGGPRARGVRSGSIAMILYGLPHQTRAPWTAPSNRFFTLKPDRIALFGYAHVQWNERDPPEDDRRIGAARCHRTIRPDEPRFVDADHGGATTPSASTISPSPPKGLAVRPRLGLVGGSAIPGLYQRTPPIAANRHGGPPPSASCPGLTSRTSPSTGELPAPGQCRPASRGARFRIVDRGPKSAPPHHRTSDCAIFAFSFAPIRHEFGGDSREHPREAEYSGDQRHRRHDLVQRRPVPDHARRAGPSCGPWHRPFDGPIFGTGAARHSLAV